MTFFKGLDRVGVEITGMTEVVEMTCFFEDINIRTTFKTFQPDVVRGFSRAVFSGVKTPHYICNPLPITPLLRCLSHDSHNDGGDALHIIFRQCGVDEKHQARLSQLLRHGQALRRPQAVAIEGFL